MSEEAMERAVQQALAREGIAEEVVAAGQFNPRGHTGSMFAGGLAGGEIGGAAGSIGEAVGDVAGVEGGMRANAVDQRHAAVDARRRHRRRGLWLRRAVPEQGAGRNGLQGRALGARGEGSTSG